jgi:L-ascorbate metabolism protein UlaG (beta-lactamase superfamily)
LRALAVVPPGVPDGPRLTWVGHATVLIELDGVRILTDPFLRDRLGPLRRRGPVPDLATLGRLDAVLVSHAHPDHFDRASLRRLPGSPIVVVPSGLGRAVRQLGFEERELVPGESTDVGGVRVAAVPARHGRWPRHPSARTLGYLVEGSTRVYFAGDTSAFQGLRSLAGRVDVALLPIGSWGPHKAPWHLGPRGAARLADMIGAAVVIPIHWGTLYPAGLARIWSGPIEAPARRFRAAAAELAPTAEMCVLRPGEEMTVRIGSAGPRS